MKRNPAMTYLEALEVAARHDDRRLSVGEMRDALAVFTRIAPVEGTVLEVNPDQLTLDISVTVRR